MPSTLTIPISYGSSVKKRPNVKAVSLGDGYEQRIRNSINTNRRTWNVSFNQRSNTEADAIDAFFEAAGAADYFLWTPPVGAAGKWVCREWDRQQQAGNTESITAIFEEVFEP